MSLLGLWSTLSPDLYSIISLRVDLKEGHVAPCKLVYKKNEVETLYRIKKIFKSNHQAAREQ